MKEAHLNKLLGNLNQTNYTRSISSADGVGTDFLSQTDFLNGSRARSTSFSSSIWNNANTNAATNNNNWPSLNLLGPATLNATPISSSFPNHHQSPVRSPVGSEGQATSPKLYLGSPSLLSTAPVLSAPAQEPHKASSQASMRTAETSESSEQQSSQSIFKNKFFNFGSSPTKLPTKSSDKSSEDISVVVEADESHASTTSSNSNGNANTSTNSSSGGGSGLLSGGFGAKSSRFFKLGSRRQSSATMHTQSSSHSTESDEVDGAAASSNGIVTGNGVNTTSSDASHPASGSVNGTPSTSKKRLSLGLSFMKGKDNKNKIVEEKEEPSDASTTDKEK
ncbi:unnamed protein product [Ambrosiozyma monospora]|uniref:Unnamed protein product n=1 Tax=Ambrosiozyma monospora TaxID=43982 RepID=A0ACB5SYJ0_AMBMO|nr:unnamed protein product [Ambrosiozyma monospora]